MQPAAVVIMSMDDLDRRVARRHAAVVRDDPAGGNLQSVEDGEILAACSDRCSVSAEDVERLLGHAGVRIDGGSVRFDEHGGGEVEIGFSATRADGRTMSGVLVVRLRAERDGPAVKMFTEVGPFW
jgi:hypothetical protein